MILQRAEREFGGRTGRDGRRDPASQAQRHTHVERVGVVLQRLGAEDAAAVDGDQTGIEVITGGVEYFRFLGQFQFVADSGDLAVLAQHGGVLQ